MNKDFRNNLKEMKCLKIFNQLHVFERISIVNKDRETCGELWIFGD